jgi:hypothetical protein
MGLEIHHENFEDEDRERFASKLRVSLSALRELSLRPGFGEGAASIGAELELSLVDAELRPAPINRAVLADTVDERLTLEVDRFNLEINARPFPLVGEPFSATARDLGEALAAARLAAAAHGARVVAIGILPTLREADLTSEALTEGRRYRALSASLRRLRNAPFELHIRGEDELRLLAEDVTYEGANTSFQVHLRTGLHDFARTYNAAQIATSLVLAVSGNSPLFLGRRLWDETRIALFRQSVDDRPEGEGDDVRPARVSFGHGWVRHGALELFEESVHLHEPLLPVCSDEDPLAVVRLGAAPKLAELRLHHGTVWRWNRAVYDDVGGGHVRIEMRALPAGPTVADMMANAAFLVGLTLGLRDEADALVTRMTFGHARRNFYEAARRGLDAHLVWPSGGASPRLAPAMALAPRLVPLARHGLVSAGVDPQEADAHLGIVTERLAARTTGARWQRRIFDDALARTGDPDRSAVEMLRRYADLSEAGAPVHTWPLG